MIVVTPYLSRRKKEHSELFNGIFGDPTKDCTSPISDGCGIALGRKNFNFSKFVFIQFTVLKFELYLVLEVGR